MLTVSGGRDRTWDSTAQARRIVDALAAAGVAHRFLDHPGAGHHVGQHPHLPFGPDGADADSRAADAAARADAWPQIVELLASS